MEKDPEKQQKFIDDTIEKCKFFQKSHLWPNGSKLNYKLWLKNFSSIEEKYIASHILSFFTYYSDSMIDKLIVDALSNAGRILKKVNPKWTNNNFYNDCFYSSVETNSKYTDSGTIFMRKLRDNFNISEKQFLSLKDAESKIRNNEKFNLIVIDDFLGSGQQFEQSLRSSMLTTSLKNQTIPKQVKIIFIPLIANCLGYNRIKIIMQDINTKIKNELYHMEIYPVHLLGEEYNLFDESCICWDNDEEIFKKGVNLILEKSKLVGIPLDNRREIDAKGYQEQGLALSFEHGTPDASLGMFYYKDNGWNPLLKKSYEI